MHIAIKDETSRVEFMEITMTLEQFGDMLSAPRMVECDFKLRAVDRIGMIAENKTEIVPVDYGHEYNRAKRKKIAAAALRPFEVDGWSAREGDIDNPHCHTKDGYRVVFFRHVKPCPNSNSQNKP